MTRPILQTLLFSLMISSVSCVRLLAQQAGQPPLHIVWNSLTEFASIESSQIAISSPHYPSASKDDSKFRSWIAEYPDEVDRVLGLFEQNGVVPSRVQLGIGERQAVYADVVPYWPNALSAFGTAMEITKQLPHMPAPKDYCSVAGYVADQEKLNSWRGSAYQKDKGGALDTANAPDPNDLFNTEVYPCLAQYYNAVDRWVYEYPEEYFKLMDACDCGEGDGPEVRMIMPDSLRPAYVPVMERVREQEEVSNEEDSYFERVDVPKGLLAQESPLVLVGNTHPELDIAAAEEMLRSCGVETFANARIPITDISQCPAFQTCQS